MNNSPLSYPRGGPYHPSKYRAHPRFRLYPGGGVFESACLRVRIETLGYPRSSIPPSFGEIDHPCIASSCRAAVHRPWLRHHLQSLTTRDHSEGASASFDQRS
eukprot:117457-Hanusia_phi.AAC.1